MISTQFPCGPMLQYVFLLVGSRKQYSTTPALLTRVKILPEACPAIAPLIWPSVSYAARPLADPVMLASPVPVLIDAA
jgi:hypothetical protein